MRTIQEFLGMLKHVSGPDANGEYMACCPAHEDSTPSMSITCRRSQKDSKERIYVHCHRGCESSQVAAALGLSMQDLIIDPDEPRGKKRAGGADRRDGGRRAGAGSADRDGKPGDGDEPGGYDGMAGDNVEVVDGVTVHTVGESFQNAENRPGAQGEDRQSGAAGNGQASADDGKKDRAGSVAGQGGAAGSGQASADNGKKAGAGSAAGAKKRADFGQLVKVYSYTDEDGKELFQVCRYEKNDGGKREKTFRQRMYAPGHEKAKQDGFVWTVPAELRDGTVYRLPAVKRAIAEGKPVYVVEGEKDVETLERLGFVATCNPGGAGSGKWKEGHTRCLAGADVIILPDEDQRNEHGHFVGQEHAYAVAVALKDVAARVRLVDIKEACPKLPPKGDITDMVAIMGDVDAMDALARLVAQTGDFDAGAVPFWIGPEEQAKLLYSQVTGYGVVDGCICQVTGESVKALCDFTVLPRAELLRDDGLSSTLYFALDGINSAGRKLERVVIRAAELDAMNWVTEKWGFYASLAPGSTTKSKVSWAIKKVGQITARRTVEYNHTGWRMIGKDLCYLYHGGAIGKDGVTVDMGDALKRYRLDGSGSSEFAQIGYADAARVSLRMKDIMREDIGVALLGVMYLAPLREFLARSGVVPAFSLFLYGEGGTHKTTAATLALSHFGNFNTQSVPASFNDTGNNLRKKAFLVKDMPFLVDDFHPTASVQEKRSMNATAQTLSRAFGDSADRGRLNSDRTVAGSAPPRSVCVITGEDLPDIGSSGLARYFILDIDKGDIPVTDDLTDMQELAREGYLQKAMRGYIQWLIKQYDGMPERLHEMFLNIRSMLRGQSDGMHDRAPAAAACILIGYQMMLKYMQDLGLFDAETSVAMWIDAKNKLMAAGRKQAASMESEKPTRIFLDTLSELYVSKKVFLKDLTAEKPSEPGAAQTMAGYIDQTYCYLLPNIAFGAVSRQCREMGKEFPVSLKALYKHLRTDRILKDVPGEGPPTRGKWIDGKNQRLLWIPVENVVGANTEAKQMAMDYAAVSDADLPDGW